MLRRSVKAGCLVVLLAAAPYCLRAAASSGDGAGGGSVSTGTTGVGRRSAQETGGATQLSFKLHQGECPRRHCTGAESRQQRTHAHARTPAAGA
jgi:hypothetical protein